MFQGCLVLLSLQKSCHHWILLTGPQAVNAHTANFKVSSQACWWIYCMSSVIYWPFPSAELCTAAAVWWWPGGRGFQTYLIWYGLSDFSVWSNPHLQVWKLPLDQGDHTWNCGLPTHVSVPTTPHWCFLIWSQGSQHRLPSPAPFLLATTKSPGEDIHPNLN